MKKLFTSESVTEGHPDKVCDRIADAVLDAALAGDPHSRVACEVTATTNLLIVLGEITTKSQFDVEKIARRVIKEIGYCDPALGFNADSVQIIVKLDKQSPDIAMGVNTAIEAQTGENYDKTGAGDQGMMFGYASDETDVLMPLAPMLAHALTKRLSEVRKNGVLPYLRPDGKAQVTVEYDGDRVKRIEAVVLSSQHDERVGIETLREELKSEVIDRVIPPALMDEHTKIYINPTGRFVVGGPHGDAGVTGRKIIVDTYGGYAAHGGGAFSGKDPTKVDRSACYYARYVAKNLVAAGLAKRVEIQLAYAIGKAHPVSVFVNTFGTGVIPDEEIAAALPAVFDFRPAAIIDKLDLLRPQYEAISNYGHFGKEGVSWERTDAVLALKALIRGH